MYLYLETPTYTLQKIPILIGKLIIKTQPTIGLIVTEKITRIYTN